MERERDYFAENQPKKYKNVIYKKEIDSESEVLDMSEKLKIRKK